MAMGSTKPTIFETAFEEYYVQQFIGEGGSGRVYKVTTKSGEAYAVKTLDPDKATPQKLKRFKNELLFCFVKEQKNIVKVVDYGYATINGRKNPFYVMPYYPSTLRQSIEKQIPKEKILPYFNQILGGVEAAHLLGVWHRDLKPENIFYDPAQDLLVVGDFGIAHFAEEELHTLVKTRPDERLASFQYAAPEQRVRESRVDQRADIYALALILNEMFTRQLIQGSDFKKIGSVAPEYEYLDDLVEMMIRQSPDKRPATIDEVKLRLIANQNEFVSRQRLSQLKNVVISEQEVDDPLVTDPVRLTRIDYTNGNLILFLSQSVTTKWVETFHSIKNWSAIAGKEPYRFEFHDYNKAVIPADESIAQNIVENFKQYLEKVNEDYNNRVISMLRENEEKEKRRIAQQIIEEERRQRILKSVRP